jgi:putative hydroxymethylpyrimidine transport system ATP-binding protein
MNNNTKIDKRFEGRSIAPSVTLEQVSFAYPGEQIFRSLNFTIKGGQWTCLIGPSGCGTSTLLRLISGTLREGLSGSIRFSDVNNHKRLTAWMSHKDLLLPWLSVVDNVCLGGTFAGTFSFMYRCRDALLFSG